MDIARTAKGSVKPATPEEKAREDSKYILITDPGPILVTDSGDILVPNLPDFGYTNPNLHRRIDQDAVPEPGSSYQFAKYDEDGNPYKQSVKIGVWDGIHSYRTTTTFIHDEESTTCEIP